MLDMVAAARRAVWHGGARGAGAAPPTRITRMGRDAPTRTSGWVHVFDAPQALSDGSTHAPSDLLHTHPAWVPDGMVVGVYPEMTISHGDELAATVGLLAGAAGSDGVTFEVGIQRAGVPTPVGAYFDPTRRTELNGFHRRLATVRSRPDGGLEEVRVDLTDEVVDGGRYRPVLIVHAGAASGRDWAAWVRPRIAPVHSISIPSVTCELETTSGFSARRRRLRRSRFSDELALFVLAVPLDADGGAVEDEVQLAQHSWTGVDSSEVVEPDVVLSFRDPAVARVEVRLLGLEIEGTGRTHLLAQHGFDSWVGHMYFPDGFAGRRAFNEEFDGPRRSNDHEIVLADYFVVDLDDVGAGGREDDVRVVVGPGGATFPDAAAYLAGRGITRAVTPGSATGYRSVETRTYQASGPRSTYAVELRYR